MQLTLTLIVLAAVFVGEENAQVAKFLRADNERQEQNKEYIPEDYMSLFDDTNRRLSAITELSSVVRGGYAPPFGMSTKRQNGKNYTFIALLRPLYALEWTK